MATLWEENGRPESAYNPSVEVLIPGPSAYDVAVSNGFVGTEAEWVASLEGPQGIQGEQGIQGIQGIQGEQGLPGEVSQAELDAAIAGVTKTVRIPHTFTISGEVKAPVGDDFYIPPFFVHVPAGQVVKLVNVRYRINSGTSVTAQLQRNGAVITTLAGDVTTVAKEDDFADVILTHNDVISLVVTAVSGTPKNMTVTVYLDYTV